ncbi:MAG: hypothetical protein ACRDYA_11410 [Egibacteraceae bacterium]
MKLQLVNDLPLFRTFDEQLLDAELAEAAVRLTARWPADVEYVPFSSLRQWWSACCCYPADIGILVGTRPSLLHSRHPLAFARVVTVATERTLNEDGFTVAARLNSPFPIELGKNCLGRLCILDDVMMSGHTIRCVCDAFPARIGSPVTVMTHVSSRIALTQIAAAHPHVVVRPNTIVEYEPVSEGTLIFLWDLFQGSLRGRPFLEQRDLLRPFFGEDLTAVDQLRDAAIALGV